MKRINRILSFLSWTRFCSTGNIHCEDDFINAIKNVTTEQVFEALINIFKRNIQYHLQLPEGLKHPEYKKVISDFDKKLQTLVRSQKSAKIQKSNIEKSQKDPQVTCFEIKPGIRLIHRENTQTPTFVLHAYLKGGLTYETASTAGSHYLISRNIACGHSKKDYTKLKTDLEMRSASLSGFGGKNAYGLTMHGQTEHWEDLVDDFFLTLLEPSLPIKYFNNEKKLINRALDNMKTDPVKQCFSAYNKHIFKGHPYQLDIIGSKESLKKISRDQIAKLHQKRLDKEEIVITYAGDIPANKIFDIVTEKLRNLPERARKVFLPKKVNSVAKDINIKFNREQTQIFIGYPAFSNQVQEDVYLKILTTHLSGQSSDLFVEVRDRQGLCYAAQAVHHNAIEAGYWGIFIGTGNDKTEKAIAAIKSIINKIATDGLSEEEVERIKKMIIGQNLVGLQTNETLLSTTQFLIFIT
jgi:zinc protease